MKRVTTFLMTAATGLILLAGLDFSPSPDNGRQYLLERGMSETGAVNLVTAIYLDYRAFDTLGETIVLLLAVSAVVFFIGKKA